MQQRLATTVLGVLLGMPYLVLAQESNSLESIANRVTSGGKVAVVTTDREKLRARFERATASDLTVRVADKTIVLPAAKVAPVI